MTDDIGAVDVHGLPVGSGGVCVRRIEMYGPAFVAIGAVLGAAPPVVLIAGVYALFAAGFDPFSSSTGGIVLIVAALFALFGAPTLITRPVLRRVATYEARYEISPAGFRRTAARTRYSLARVPAEVAFPWTAVQPIGDAITGEPRVFFDTALLPWRSRRVRLDDGRSFVLSGASDWLNPWPAIPDYGDDESAMAWSRVRLEDFIVAAAEAFAARHLSRTVGNDRHG